MRLATRAKAILVCATALPLLMLASQAGAQIPDEFTNLKMLDKDTTQQQIVGIMRDWAGGLGVRCNHCHVGPDDLVGMDFASDEKATKRSARKMLEMSRELNRTLLADLPTVAEGERHQMVSCYTCHRGEAKPPQNISVALGPTFAAEGIDAALEEYRSLRAEHYGAGKYDFTSQRVFGLAQQVLQGGSTDDARKMLEMGLEYDPESALLYAGLSMVALTAGDVAAARTAAEKALELEPDHGMAKQVLARLDASGQN